MYSTCLFCHSELGKNEVIEPFPVGRRLAFDSGKGRLWVVCRRCERWNLTPLEERWEAIEECERVFSATRMRVSTDNIGLARVREGLELVRIGEPRRPEMAAWRYGDQFGRRRRNHLLLSGAGVAAIGGIVVLGPVTGIIAGGGWGAWQGLQALYSLYENRRARLKLKLPGEETVVTIRKKHLEHTGLRTDPDTGWLLDLSYDPGHRRMVMGQDYQMVKLRGEAAMRVAGQILPKINEKGARSRQVQEAVHVLERYSDPQTLFSSQVKVSRVAPRGRSMRSASIANLPLEVRLALEMAAHEEQERRALEGELALLEAAWRDAEEVACIADDMFLPEDTMQRLEELRRRA